MRRLPPNIQPWIIPLAVVLLVVVVYAAVSTQIAAVVGSRVITQKELTQRLNVIQFSYDQQFGKSPGYQADFARRNQREVLSQLVEEYVLLSQAKELATDEEQAAYASTLIEWMQTGLFQGDSEAFAAALEKNSLPESVLRTYLGNNLLWVRLREQVTKDIDVTEAEVEQYYADNRASFDMPEMVKAAHIVVEKRTLAEELLTQLQEGADFALLASLHSVDTESAAQGGNLGWFARGQMVAEFEEAAFSLEPGQVSDIVETTHGFHIIKLESKDPGRPRPFAEVAQQVKERALAAKKDRAWDEYRRQALGRKLVLLFVR